MGYIWDRFGDVFRKGTKTKLSEVGARGLIYELAGEGYGELDFIKTMRVYEFLDLVKYQRLKKEVLSV